MAGQDYTYPSSAAPTVTVSAIGPNGAAIPSTSILIAGKGPTSLLTPISTDVSGNLNVNLVSGITNPLPVTVTASVLPTGAATEATLSALNGKVVVADTGNVTIVSSALPTGAATAANQATEIASLASIDSKLTSPITVTGPLTDAQLRASPVPISAASLPLPTGAATETTLAALNTKVANDFGVSSGAVRTAAQIGNASGAADFNAGAAGAQTLRVVVASGGAAPAAPSGRTVVTTVRNDYSSVNVTTGAWVQLVASLSATVNVLDIFDSSGQTLEIGIGAPAAETRLILDYPGGNGQIPVTIASGTRVSIRAVSATANSGEIDINFLG